MEKDFSREKVRLHDPGFDEEQFWANHPGRPNFPLPNEVLEELTPQDIWVLSPHTRDPDPDRTDGAVVAEDAPVRPHRAGGLRRV